jgi:hypothetical protein
MDTNHAVFSLGHVLLKVRVSPEAVAANCSRAMRRSMSR